MLELLQLYASFLKIAGADAVHSKGFDVRPPGDDRLDGLVRSDEACDLKYALKVSRSMRVCAAHKVAGKLLRDGLIEEIPNDMLGKL